jgi:hypothetical protein
MMTVVMIYQHLPYYIHCAVISIDHTALSGADADASSLVESHRLPPLLLRQAQPTGLRHSSGATQLHLPRWEEKDFVKAADLAWVYQGKIPEPLILARSFCWRYLILMSIYFH